MAKQKAWGTNELSAANNIFDELIALRENIEVGCKTGIGLCADPESLQRLLVLIARDANLAAGLLYNEKQTQESAKRLEALGAKV